MNHIHVVLQRYPDNIVLSEIGGDRCHALAHEVRLVRLVPMVPHSVFVRVDGDGGHGELMDSTEHSNGDFTSVSDEHLLQRSRVARLSSSKAGDAEESGVSLGAELKRRVEERGSRLCWTSCATWGGEPVGIVSYPCFNLSVGG